MFILTQNVKNLIYSYIKTIKTDFVTILKTLKIEILYIKEKYYTLKAIAT